MKLKSQLSKCFLIAIVFLKTATLVSAQEQNITVTKGWGARLTNYPAYSWSVTASGGMLLFYGDYRVYNVWPVVNPVSEINGGYGLSVSNQILPFFALQANILGGELSGEKRNHNYDKTSKDYWGNSHPRYFKGSIFEYSLVGKINIVPLILGRQGKLDVIGYGGIGNVQYRAVSRIMGTNKVINAVGYEGSTIVSDGTKSSKTPSAFVAPIGLILNYHFSNRVSLGLDLSQRLVGTDNLDSRAYPNSKNDQYGYYALGLTYSFGHNPVLFKVGEKKAPKKKVEDAQKKKDDAARAEQMKKDEEAKAEQDRKDAEAKAEQARKDEQAKADQDKKDAEAKAAQAKKDEEARIAREKEEMAHPMTAKEKLYIENTVVRYQYNSEEIEPAYNSKLDKMVEILNKHTKAELQITGHADDKGTEGNNIIVSQRRAETMKNYLVSKGLTNPDRVSIDFKGSSKPVSSNRSEAGRAMNRRANFKLKYTK